jgi:small subunit ribosomal protein S16
MLKIRLSRIGRKHVPFYRVVLTEHTNSAKHGEIAVLGHYNPISKDFHIDQDKAQQAITHGAQYSPTVQKLVSKYAK